MELNEMKKKYESGEYILICKVVFLKGESDWGIANKFYKSGNLNMQYKLIHKKHKPILEAYLEDNEMDIFFKYRGVWQYLVDDFIESYDENDEYSITPTEDEIKRKDEADYPNLESVHTQRANPLEQYGFEYKEGVEILSEYVGGVNKTTLLVGYVIEDHGEYKAPYTYIWDKETGWCYNNDDERVFVYDLQPLKKEWYEDKRIFDRQEVLIKDSGNCLFVVHKIINGIMYDANGNDICIASTAILATKQERDSLYCGD